MATAKLFRLKAEVAPAAPGLKAHVLPIARVRVNTGVFHLADLYEYLVPETLSSTAQVGVRVQLNFGNKEVEGIVVQRCASATRAGELKTISKVLSPHPVATSQSLELMDLVAAYYAGNSWDIIRAAIPPRVASVDKVFLKKSVFSAPVAKSKTEFLTLRPVIPVYLQICEMVVTALKRGSVLVVAPDEADVEAITNALREISCPVLKLTAAMPRAQRYLNFLSGMNESLSVVVGTRSAVFAPMPQLATIIVFKESAYDHYEIRTPGWNTRAVAELRSKQQGCQLLLTGYAPSMEIASAIDAGQVKFRSMKEALKVSAFSPTEGTLLPGRIFPEIRKALKMGPVLFLAPRKGYGNALLCAHCRNIAICDCGGRLAVAAKLKPPMCVHCGKSFPSWRCTFCNRDKQYLAGRGVERAAEEISRAFPNTPVVISAADVIKREIAAKPSLVLATPGAQPQVSGGYSAVVILDGIRFFAHTDLRTQERARELFLESSALISASGAVLLVIDQTHPIVSAISRWNVVPLLKRELSERAELGLPPSVTSAVIVLDANESISIADGLNKAVAAGRMPPSTRISGPTPIGKNQSKIVIRVDLADSMALRMFLHELQSKRCIAKKEVFALRLDPYSL